MTRRMSYTLLALLLTPLAATAFTVDRQPESGIYNPFVADVGDPPVCSLSVDVKRDQTDPLVDGQADSKIVGCCWIYWYGQWYCISC